MPRREALLESSVKDNEEALGLRKLECNAGKSDTLSVLQLQAKVDSARSGLVSLRQARRAEKVNLYLSLDGGI